MSIADDLTKALRGANITINVQGGHGNTMYTGPVQINNNAARGPKPVGHCYYCHKPVMKWDHYDHGFFGETDHWSCIHAYSEQRKKLESPWRETGRTQIVDESDVIELADPIIDEAHQIAAPLPEPEVIWVRDDPAKYAHLPTPYYVPLVPLKVIKP